MNSLRIEQLTIPNTIDITDLFSHFAFRPWSMLLDSANSSRSNARYDFFVAEPILTFEATTDGSRDVTVTHHLKKQTQRATNNVFSLLKTALDDYLPNISPHTSYPHLPFLGGLVGHFGYDFAVHCDSVMTSQFEGAYDTPSMAVGLYTWSVILDRQTHQWLLVSHADYPHPKTAEIEALVRNPVTTEPFKLTQPWQGAESVQSYQKKIEHIHDYLVAGDCYQVNFTQRFASQFEGDAWAAYLLLRQENAAPFSAFIRQPNNRAILSVSPERFIQCQHNGLAETQPIKGTRPRMRDTFEDVQQQRALSESAKDRAENLMIVDLLRNDFSKHCLAHTVKTPQLFELQSFPSVHHLVSTVTGQLSPKSHPLDLFAGAFPGGSITGAPKIRAMQIIDELEVFGRSVYCGSIGYVSAHGAMDTNICIRTLLCENDNIYCWAGGGIVLDSKAEEEYSELFDKVMKILPILEKTLCCK